jgi:hypothetical protein
VIDCQSHEPIDNAVVSAVFETYVLRTTTDVTGVFRLEGAQLRSLQRLYVSGSKGLYAPHEFVPSTSWSGEAVVIPVWRLGSATNTSNIAGQVIGVASSVLARNSLRLTLTWEFTNEFGVIRLENSTPVVSNGQFTFKEVPRGIVEDIATVISVTGLDDNSRSSLVFSLSKLITRGGLLLVDVSK